jgi:hypothetical protein
MKIIKQIIKQITNKFKYICYSVLTVSTTDVIVMLIFLILVAIDLIW